MLPVISGQMLNRQLELATNALSRSPHADTHHQSTGVRRDQLLFPGHRLLIDVYWMCVNDGLECRHLLRPTYDLQLSGLCVHINGGLNGYKNMRKMRHKSSIKNVPFPAFFGVDRS